jgi:hypothetical protein
MGGTLQQPPAAMIEIRPRHSSMLHRSGIKMCKQRRGRSIITTRGAASPRNGPPSPWAVTCEYESYSRKEHYAPRHAHRTLPVPAGASAVRYCAVLTQCTLRSTPETSPARPRAANRISREHGGGSVLWRCRWRSCCGRPRRASSSCSARQRRGLSARCRTQHGTLQRSAAYGGVRCNAG